MLLNARYFLKIAHRDGYIRAVNYHSTPINNSAILEEHLRFYSNHYTPVSLHDLSIFFKEKKWKKRNPGLIISFDDGYLSNYTVAKPLLEKYGFIGWFFVPTDRIVVNELKGRDMINWNELKDLGKRHVVGSHTKTHCRLKGTLTRHKMEEEIVLSKCMLQERLKKEIVVFCWVGGEEWSYSSLAAQIIFEAGYHFSFMTNSAPITINTSNLQLQRTNIESSWPLEDVKLSLSLMP